MSHIKIALIDDHTLFRSGIKALLSRQKDFEVIGEAADGLQGAATPVRPAAAPSRWRVKSRRPMAGFQCRWIVSAVSPCTSTAASSKAGGPLSQLPALS